MRSDSKAVAIDHYLFRRASKRLYKKFAINSLELSLLLKLAGYTDLVGREIVSLNSFRGYYSASYKDKLKIDQVTWYCNRKNWIGSYEFIKIPGSKCIGLSILGKAIIEDYFKTVQTLAKSLKPKKKTTGSIASQYRLVA
jgi:hypothetical protein